MPLFRSKAEDKVRNAGYDPARLPPGQYLTEKWPVLHAGSVPRLGIETWQLRALPATTVTTDIHCVTRWSRFDAGFRGVRWRELAALCKPLPAAHFVVAHAPQNFTANLPLEALADDDAMICYEADGEPLTAEHGGPVRLVVPSRYFWKSAKWLTGLELVAADQPGFWERLGYHNDADPWREERYGF